MCMGIAVSACQPLFGGVLERSRAFRSRFRIKNDGIPLLSKPISQEIGEFGRGLGDGSRLFLLWLVIAV